MRQAIWVQIICATITMVRCLVRKINLSFLLVILLAGLLATLGTLQYRWIGELSNDERERMRSSANVAAESLSREFDREITRVFLQLQIDPISYEKNFWDDYNSRYERWRATTLYPRLVNKVFVADKSSLGATRLSVYNSETQRFDESDWPPQFAVLQSQIEQDFSSQSATDNEKSKRPPVIVTDETTALVIPISNLNLLNLDQLQKAANNGLLSGNLIRRIGYTIVLLDSDYIKTELLPILVARYFNSSGNNNPDRYDVTITSCNDSSRIFYQSNLLQSGAPPEGDVEREFFNLRFDEFENLLPAKFDRKPESLGLKSGDQEKRKISVSVIGSSNKNDSTYKINSINAVPLLNNSDSHWRLAARHQSGSLDAVVEKTRRRNLFVVGGILSLLGASGVLLLVSANRARQFARRQTDFVAGVTHELRTPLAVIRSMSENLADGIVTDREKIRQYGCLINDEERRLSAMVEHLLGFAGAQTAPNIELRPQNVAEIIEAALEDYRSEFKKRNFDVETIIEPELAFVMADADALRRAIGNLISNAVKYSDAVRNVKITARAIYNRKSAHVEIIIKDEGAGIDSKDLSDVFKLFYRGRAATEGQIEGSGIGLSLVKQLRRVEN